jgi:hypothetical protein
MNRMSERETTVKLPFAADCCPCVEKLRTVLPSTVGIRDGAVKLVSTLNSVITSARAGLGSIMTSALPVFFLLTRQRVWPRRGERRGTHLSILFRVQQITT